MAKQDEINGKLLNAVDTVEKIQAIHGDSILKNTVAVRVIFIVLSLVVSTFGLIEIFNRLAGR